MNTPDSRLFPWDLSYGNVEVQKVLDLADHLKVGFFEDRPVSVSVYKVIYNDRGAVVEVLRHPLYDEKEFPNYAEAEAFFSDKDIPGMGKGTFSVDDESEETSEVIRLLGREDGMWKTLSDRCSIESREEFEEDARRALGNETEVSGKTLNKADWEYVYNEVKEGRE